ncbi:hypothetical protein [Aquirufa sp. A-Brett2-W8]
MRIPGKIELNDETYKMKGGGRVIEIKVLPENAAQIINDMRAIPQSVFVCNMYEKLKNQFNLNESEVFAIAGKKDDIIYALMVLMGLQSFDIILDKDFNQNSFLNFTGETLDYYDNKEYFDMDDFNYEIADEDEEVIENTDDL